MNHKLNSKKILMISSSFYPDYGGFEVFIKEIAERTVKNYDSVIVLTKALTSAKREEKINGVEIFRVSKPVSISESTNSYIPTFLFIFPAILYGSILIRRKKISLIHCHGTAGCICGYFLKKMTGRPLLLTIQGGDLAEYPEMNNIFFSPLKILISQYLKNADCITCVSTHLINKVRKMGGENLLLIPNGVDLDRFRPTAVDSSNILNFKNKSLLISVSRLTEKNGLEYLIKAIPAILNEVQNAHLLIIGGGPVENKLKDLVRQLNLENDVTFIGVIPHNDVQKYLSVSDVFIRASLDEGFGIAFIEAMAMGVPVIGTDVGGIPDIIQHGTTGLLVKPCNPEMIATSVIRLHKDVQFKKTIITNAKNHVKERFDWSKIFQKIDNAYSMVLQ
jgi:glycosyltransferase involved in cell wall biosynthesis